MYFLSFNKENIIKLFKIIYFYEILFDIEILAKLNNKN
jgi:hypothetical protein